jgi:hypothetical protein
MEQLAVYGIVGYLRNSSPKNVLPFCDPVATFTKKLLRRPLCKPASHNIPAPCDDLFSPCPKTPPESRVQNTPHAQTTISCDASSSPLPSRNDAPAPSPRPRTLLLYSTLSRIARCSSLIAAIARRTSTLLRFAPDPRTLTANGPQPGF